MRDIWWVNPGKARMPIRYVHVGVCVGVYMHVGGCACRDVQAGAGRRVEVYLCVRHVHHSLR